MLRPLWVSLAFTLCVGTSGLAAAAPPPEPADASDPDLVLLPDLASFNRCDKQPVGARFRITLPEEAELKDLVGWISSVSCQKFVWDPAVRGGKITIVAPEPVTLAEAYGAFHSALQTMNLAVQDAGDFFEIVETKGIAGRTVAVVGPNGKPAASARFVTQVIRPHRERIADVAAVFTHLKSEHGAVQTVGGIVLVTDTANNIRRAMKVAKHVDVAENTREGLYVYPLEVADADVMADLLRQILGDGSTAKSAAKPKAKRPTGRQTTQKQVDAAADATTTSASSATLTRVVADTRTRSLFIVAPRQDYPTIRAVIERLDTSMAGDQGEITVIRLNYADPVELQGVLAQVVAGRQDAAPSVTVTAEPATGSLIIDAPYHETKRLQSLIAGLDVKRRQVYMEVYLLEVSTDRTLQLGAGAHFGTENPASLGGGSSFVSSNPSTAANTLVPSTDALSGLAAGIFGPTLPGALLGQDLPSFGVMIQAIENSSDVNTISEPHVTTADNRTAKITVGEVIPVPGDIVAAGGSDATGNFTTRQSVSRESVALEVEITPHVNDEREVMLDIKLLNEQALPAASTDIALRTSKQALELEDVIAHDGQPLVLGGLIKDEESIVETKVPGLANIPLLGWLFKSRRRPKKKVNLLMIVIPHIIESPDDARRIHERRMSERREFLERETAFKRKDLDLHINYRKKAGLLATVEAEHARMRLEDAHRQRAEIELQRGLPIEIGVPDTKVSAR